jgi:hypothetical protein
MLAHAAIEGLRPPFEGKALSYRSFNLENKVGFSKHLVIGIP